MYIAEIKYYKEKNGNKKSNLLTKREAMASIAMQGFLSNPNLDLTKKDVTDIITKNSVFLADALLEALDQS